MADIFLPGPIPDAHKLVATRAAAFRVAGGMFIVTAGAIYDDRGAMVVSARRDQPDLFRKPTPEELNR